jgi:hypothetical protein
VSSFTPPARTVATVMHRVPEATPDPRLPNAFIGAVAFATTLVMSVAMETLNQAAGGTELVLMAVTVGLLCWWSRPLPSLFISLCGWLTFDGMVVNGSGHLGWAGREDAVRVAVIFAAGLGAAAIREVTLRLGGPHA